MTTAGEDAHDDGYRPRGGTRPVSRRAALAAGVAGLGTLTAGRRMAAAAPTAGAAASARPNILWLVSEDNNPFLGAYGDPVARTPALDRLAAQGVRYAACFSAAPVCAPSRFALITGMYAETTGPAEHMRASATLPTWMQGFPRLLRAKGYFCTNNAKTDYNSNLDVRATWDESSKTAHWRHRPAGAPFFSVFNFETTHESMIFKDASTPLPDGVTPASVRIPAYQPDTPTARSDRARYYDQMTRMDTQIAGLLRQLSADGLARSTIVFYFSDNGGVLPRSKRFCYDSGTHTPLMIRYPVKFASLSPFPAGTVVPSPVSSVDLAPTVLSLAGITPPGHMQGLALAGPAHQVRTHAFSARDRMGERYDMQRSVRSDRYRYIRNYLPHLPYGQFVLFGWHQAGYREWERLHRAGGLPPLQSAFWQPKPAEELYDLLTDRDEVLNLVDSPDHAAVLQELRDRLDEHLLAVNDNGFIPEGAPLEGYDASRVRGAYPLAQVMSVAATAIRRDAANEGRLTGWLTDPSPVVRLWAAHGVRMMPGGVPAAAPQLKVLLSDEYPSVRVAAAEALCVSGSVEPGLEGLSSVLLHGAAPSFRLQAANALDSLGALAKPALPALKQAIADKDQLVVDSARHTVAVLEGRYRP